MQLKTIMVYATCSVVLAACSTNPVTGRKQLMLVSEASAIASSKEAYAQMLQPLDREGKIDTNPVTAKRVRDITERLIPHAIAYRPETQDWEWSVKVIDDPKTINAFCMAGGKMAVYTGLITQLKITDDELAQVMGHEIAHALSAHTAERMSVAMASDLAVMGVAMTQNNSNLAMSAGAVAAAVAVKLPNSRKAESEADRIGIELAAKAGYDPQAAVTLWEKMGKANGGSSGTDFLSTHPDPQKRMETLQGLVEPMMPFYQDKSPRPLYKLKG